MRFRRKAQSEPVEDDGQGEVPADEPDLVASGPHDVADLPQPAEDDRVDLGSLLVAPEANRELRLQVDEASGAVQSVVLAGPDGALEVRAFAAPRNGDLWSEVRPRIAAEVAQSGGTATERTGPWGQELVCQVGQRGGATQTTRIVGINGPRWMLRCSLLGAAAAQPEQATDWEDSIRRLVVRRGEHAMPVGEALPVVMPPQARRAEPNG